MLNQSCIPGINSTWTFYIIFYILLDLICSYFVKGFMSVFMRDVDLVSFVSQQLFSIRVILIHKVS